MSLNEGQSHFQKRQQRKTVCLRDGSTEYFCKTFMSHRIIVPPAGMQSGDTTIYPTPGVYVLEHPGRGVDMKTWIPEYQFNQEMTNKENEDERDGSSERQDGKRQRDGDTGQKTIGTTDAEA